MVAMVTMFSEVSRKSAESTWQDTKTIQPKRSSLLDGMLPEKMDLATAALAYASEKLGEHTVGEVTEDCCCKWPIWPLCFLGWYLC